MLIVLFYPLAAAICGSAKQHTEDHNRHHLLRYEHDLHGGAKKAQTSDAALTAVVTPAAKLSRVHGATHHAHMFETWQRSGVQTINPCGVYRLPGSALPSGYGNMWEYGHFIMDFAPPIYFHLQHTGAGCKTLIVPPAGEWQLTCPGDYLTTKHVFDFFFGPMQLSIVRQNETNAGSGTLIDINPHDHPWATFDAAVYTSFREYAWSTAAAVSSPEPITTHDLVVIKRIMPDSSYKGPVTGAQRRKLDDDFYDKLMDAVQKNKTWSLTIEAFETKSMYWQVEKLHRAKILLGQTGSGLNNALFLRPGSFLIEVGVNPEKKLPPSAENLAPRLGLKYSVFTGNNFHEDMIPSGDKRSLDDDEQTTRAIAKVMKAIADFLG